MLELEKALYDDPADFTAALLLGRAARAAGRRELALDAFVLASQIDAEAVEPWMQLARLALQRDQLNRAEQLCQRVLEIDDQCGGAHNLLGRIWLDRSHWERAIERFERALALQPDSLFYRNNLGLALIYRKDFQRAVEVLAPLAERSGVRAFMLNNLGLAYEGTGRLQDAIAQFENALERNENYTNARINHERMVRVAQRDDAGSLEREEAAAGEADGASTSSPEDMPPESGSEDLILPAAVER
jgi:tetratricopeptide (TPR) repeat protein